MVAHRLVQSLPLGRGGREEGALRRERGPQLASHALHEAEEAVGAGAGAGAEQPGQLGLSPLGGAAAAQAHRQPAGLGVREVSALRPGAQLVVLGKLGALAEAAAGGGGGAGAVAGSLPGQIQPPLR